MFDFMVKNASLPDGKVGMDVGCKNGIITAILGSKDKDRN